jgi:predicted transcriptional regulator
MHRVTPLKVSPTGRTFGFDYLPAGRCLWGAPGNSNTTMLKIMKEKGLVERVSARGRVAWAARLTQEAAGGGMLQSLMNRLFEGSAQRVVLHLLDGGKLSQKDRDEIRQLLESKPKG